MERRKFLNTAALGSLGLSFVLNACLTQKSTESIPLEFKKMMEDLLKQWCDGMIAVQIHNPENPELHGALGCPSCDFIHGRCMDAVYPFLYMADKTGDKKYTEAAILVMTWAENNVSQADGSWTVIPDPKSWRGISVFGAIALAEALHYHGHVLDEIIRTKWIERLSKVAKFIFDNFSMTYSNVNYGATAVYALNLLGRFFDNPEYMARSRELAKDVKSYFTEPNKLLSGEGKPVDGKSARGLLPVDLGYNVEESLNGLVMYALQEKDEELLQVLSKSLHGHLEFMLPDGAWDNSWGTRQYKWSYWGSRTTDGCQQAYGMMADRKPEFGTAAYRNTELLQRCTGKEYGLLYGGPHFESHGIKPCVHHTFAHAKSLASLLDLGDKLPAINNSTPLPRELANGVKEFPEVATWLVARGPWRATVSAYDWEYKEHAQPASGGAIGVLYHEEIGLLLTASMAKYMMVEPNNQQPNPEEDFALTPRIESFQNGIWYTNLYDLEAKVSQQESENTIRFEVETQVQDEDRNKLSGNDSNYQLSYSFGTEKVEVRAKRANGNASSSPAALVIPIVSPSGEIVAQTSSRQIEISKGSKKVVVDANVPIRIKKTEKSRVFNMVPGVEALPLLVDFPEGFSGEVIVEIKVV